MNSELDKIRKKIEAEAPLRVRGLFKKRKENLKDFLIKFFTKWNNEYETIYVNNGHCQTEPGCRRSLGDVYKIARYYYPNCTLEEIIELLYFEFPTSIPHFRSSNCSVIRKRVFYIGEVSQHAVIMEKAYKDEYKVDYETYKIWLEI